MLVIIVIDNGRLGLVVGDAVVVEGGVSVGFVVLSAVGTVVGIVVLTHEGTVVLTHEGTVVPPHEGAVVSVDD